MCLIMAESMYYVAVIAAYLTFQQETRPVKSRFKIFPGTNKTKWIVKRQKLEKEMAGLSVDNLGCLYEATKIFTLTELLIPYKWVNVYKTHILIPTSKIADICFFV